MQTPSAVRSAPAPARPPEPSVLPARPDAAGAPPGAGPAPGRDAPPRPGVSPEALLGIAAGAIAVLVAAGLSRPRDATGSVFGRRLRRLPGAGWAERVVAEGRHARAPHEEPVSQALGGLAGQWPTFGAGALAAAAVARRRGARAALPVLAAAPVAACVHAAVKYSVGRRRPLTARLTGKQTPSFPSGHAARGAALAGVLAHVATREALLPPIAALPLAAAVAGAGGGSRVWVERHWISDAVGGWALGGAVAALCARWYDRAA